MVQVIKKRLKPIPEWKKAYLMWSQRFNAMALSMCGFWIVLPEDKQAVLLAYLGLNAAAIPGVLIIASMVARMFQQGNLATPTHEYETTQPGEQPPTA